MKFGAYIHNHYRQRQDLSQADPGSFAAKFLEVQEPFFKKVPAKKYHLERS